MIPLASDDRERGQQIDREEARHDESRRDDDRNCSGEKLSGKAPNCIHHIESAVETTLLLIVDVVLRGRYPYRIARNAQDACQEAKAHHSRDREEQVASFGYCDYDIDRESDRKFLIDRQLLAVMNEAADHSSYDGHAHYEHVNIFSVQVCPLKIRQTDNGRSPSRERGECKKYRYGEKAFFGCQVRKALFYVRKHLPSG